MKRLVWIGVFALFGMLLATGATANELTVGSRGGYGTLTEAVAAASAGDTIYVSAGIYSDETYPIVIDKTLTIAGETGAVLAGEPYLAMIRVVAPDVTLKNIAFRLLRWGVVTIADRLTLDQCMFTLADSTYRVSSCGVWLAGVKECAVTNCAFTGCGVCMAGSEISGRSQGKPVLTGLFEVGEDSAYFTSHTLRDNTVNEKPLYYFVNRDGLTVPSDAGAVIAAGCDRITVSGLDVSDSSIGVALLHCRQPLVTDVTADRCGIFGAYLGYVSQGILQSVSTTQSNHGIDLRGVDFLTLDGCSTPDCEQGIFLAFAKDCMVSGCDVLRCGNGIFLASGEGNQLYANRIAGNQNGVYAQGDRDVLLWGNTIDGNTVAGIRLLRASGRLLGNTVTGNRTGVMVIESENITLSMQDFSSNLSCALYLRDMRNSRIVGNQFTGDSGHHIETDGVMTDVYFSLNTLRDGWENAVWNHTGDIWYAEGESGLE